MDVDVEMKSVNTTPIKSQPTLLSPTVVGASVEQMSASSKVKCQLALKDPDSSIEKMETLEQMSPAGTPQKDQATTNPLDGLQKGSKSTEERMEIMLSKILNATWNEYCTGSMICPQTASFLEKHMELRFDFDWLSSNVLMESVLKLYNDEDVIEDGGDANIDEEMKSEIGAKGGADSALKKDSTPTYSTPKKIKSDDSEVQEILANVIDDQPSTSRGLQSGRS